MLLSIFVEPSPMPCLDSLVRVQGKFRVLVMCGSSAFSDTDFVTSQRDDIAVLATVYTYKYILKSPSSLIQTFCDKFPARRPLLLAAATHQPIFRESLGTNEYAEN